MTESSYETDLVSLSSDIVCAYVSNNNIPAAELPALIATVHSAIAQCSSGASAAIASPVANKEPAVPVKKSITPEFLICLEDGKKLKSLKRHLGTLGLSPQQYRAKWGLPSDYPMVAPNYAAQRSALAKAIGLGRGNPRPVGAQANEDAQPQAAEAPQPLAAAARSAATTRVKREPKARKAA